MACSVYAFCRGCDVKPRRVILMPWLLGLPSGIQRHKNSEQGWGGAISRASKAGGAVTEAMRLYWAARHLWGTKALPGRLPANTVGGYCVLPKAWSQEAGRARPSSRAWGASLLSRDATEARPRENRERTPCDRA